MRTLILTIVLAAASLLQAQDALEAVIIPVKTLTGDSFDRLVKLLGVFNNARYSADKNLRTIIVYAPKDVVEQVRKIVNELDRPGSEAAIGRNIEMTMTFLKCSTKPAAGASTLPADLEAVAKQLRAATQYKNIELWDILPLRLQEGKFTEQKLRLPGSPVEATFATAEVKLLPEAVGRKDQTRYVRFSQVQIHFQVPIKTGADQFQYQSFGLTTSGDFVEGQKTVLGKISGMDEDGAIFVVIALKVLD